MIIISEKLKNKKTWKREYERINDYFKDNIGENGTFNKYVAVKFYSHSNKAYRMQINDYFINLIMWQPFIRFKRVLKSDIFFNTENITQKSIKAYFDEVIISEFKGKYSTKLINRECARVLEVLANICTNYGLILGQGINIYNFIRLSQRNPRFKELINTNLSSMMQPSEIEAELASLNKELVSILKTEDNVFKHFLNSGQGVKPDQLNECFVSEGLKPDLEGNTYPIPINTNLFVKGLDSPLHYFLDACGGRKALIMNKEYTGASGYFARRLDLLCLNIKLHDDPEYDCKTKHLVKFTINNHAELIKLNGLYYKKNPNDLLLKIIDKKDLRLIGKTVYLRNATTCNSKDGICHKCYGELSKINNDIAIGLFAVKELTSQYTQKILSSKHLLKTHSVEIKMGKFFDELFLLDGGNIILNPTAEQLKRYSIVIDPNDIESENEFDDEDNLKSISHFKILNHKTKHTIKIEDKNKNRLFISDYLFSELIYDSENKYYIIDMHYIAEDEVLFWAEIANNELTKPLNDTKRLIDSKEHCGCQTIDEMSQLFCKYLLDSGIDTHMTHIFVIMRNIMRQPNNILNLPDYSNEDMEYTMLSVSKALKFHPSPIVSISFERIKEQFKNPVTFKKCGSSMLDPLFKINYK